MNLKRYALTLLLVLSSFSPLGAETAFIKVTGMFCAICAQGIEANLKKEASVEKVNVDLGKKVVSVEVKKDQKLSDEKIKEVIKNAGFEVKSIERK